MEKLLRESFEFIYLSLILIQTVFKSGNNYYLPYFQKECKYAIKKRKMRVYINDEEDALEKIQIEKESIEEESSKKELSEEESRRRFKKILMRKTKYLYA